MNEPTKEQPWKEEARKAYQDQQSQDNEGGCREPIGFVQGYLAAKKSDFEKIAELEKLSDMQARDAFSRYDEIKTLKEQLAKTIKLAGHSFDCHVFTNGKHECSCGFSELRKEILEKQDKENKE